MQFNVQRIRHVAQPHELKVECAMILFLQSNVQQVIARGLRRPLNITRNEMPEACTSCVSTTSTVSMQHWLQAEVRAVRGWAEKRPQWTEKSESCAAALTISVVPCHWTRM